MNEQNQIDAWATYFKTFQRLQQAMEEENKGLELPSFEIYDVLWTLEQAHEHRLRMSELSEKVYLARFNVTRICDKLEEQGLIEKLKCPLDKRGVHAQMTDAGLKLRKKIWSHYKKMIDDKFSSKLTQTDHKDLIRILSKLKIAN